MKGRGGGGNPGSMQNLIKQANSLQMKIKKLQEELAERTHEGTAGGNGVIAKVKGENSLVGLQINEDVFKSGDVEMLQDLVVAAVNDALTKARATHSAEMEKVTGGMNFPGMF